MPRGQGTSEGSIFPVPLAHGFKIFQTSFYNISAFSLVTIILVSLEVG